MVWPIPLIFLKDIFQGLQTFLLAFEKKENVFRIEQMAMGATNFGDGGDELLGHQVLDV